MKDPQEIVTKIKQIQFEHLKGIYKKNLSKEPQNCVYNKMVVIRGDTEVATRVCGYYSKDDVYEVCNSLACSEKCNAFVARHTKPELRRRLEQDMQENPKKYPEITVLNWTLENPPVPNADFTWWERMKWGWFKFWRKFL